MQDVKASFFKNYLRGLLEFLVAPNRITWVIFDLISLPFIFIFFVWLSPKEVWGQFQPDLINAGITYSVFFIIIALGFGYYDKSQRFKMTFVARTAAVTCAISFVLTIAFVYLFFYKVFGRYNLIFGSLGCALISVLIRYLLSRFLISYPFRFIFLGRSNLTEEVIFFFRNQISTPKHYDFVGVIELNEESPDNEMQAKIKNDVAAVIINHNDLVRSEASLIALQALKLGARVTDDITFFAEIFERVPIGDQTRTWIIRESVQTHHFIRDISKRIFDIVFSAIAIVALSVPMLLIALLIKLTDFGPSFYFQKRHGKYGNPFVIIKFRTMRVGSSVAGGLTQHKDERVTWIGKIIRPLHLDELPQLWNILRGEMSIVGPRPEYFELLTKMNLITPLYELRLLATPGLTGWAQINQGYTMDSIDEIKLKLSFDLFYVCRHSLWLDMRIIIRTIFTLARRAR